MWVATQAPHEHRAFCARLLGIPEHRVRAIARDTGGGFGQKIFVQREEMAVMLAATKLPVAVKWIEDRQENLTAAGWSRHEHADIRMGFDDDRFDPGRLPRLRVRRGGLSDAVAGDARHVRRRHLPRAVSGPRRRVPVAFRLHQHGGPFRLPGAVAVRDARPGGHARHRRPADGHRSRRAAAPQPPAHRGHALQEPQRHALRLHQSAGDVRGGAVACSTTTPSAPSRRQHGRRAATSVSASPTSASRPRRPSASSRPRAPRSASSPPAR